MSEATAEKKPLKKNTKKNINGNIVLFGSSTSGKTVYIASLYKHTKNSEEGLNTGFIGLDSGSYLEQLITPLEKNPREWPDATPYVKKLTLHLKLESELNTESPEINVGVYDPPGEWLSIFQKEEKSEAEKKLYKNMATADSILCFFEPNDFSFSIINEKIKKIIPVIKRWNKNAEKRLPTLVSRLIKEYKDGEVNTIISLLERFFHIPTEDYAKRGDLSIPIIISNILASNDDKIESQLMGYLMDQEAKYIFIKYSLDISLIIKNCQGKHIITTNKGGKFNILYELIQKFSYEDEQRSIHYFMQYIVRENIGKLMSVTEQIQYAADHNNKLKSIGIIITKSDQLDVFREAKEKPYELIPSHLNKLKSAEGKNRLKNLQNALIEHWSDKDKRWKEVIEGLFDKDFKSLFLTLMRFSGDFQVFFVSSVGSAEYDENGFSRPALDLQPEGIDKPMLWAGKKIHEKLYWNRFINMINKKI